MAARQAGIASAASETIGPHLTTGRPGPDELVPSRYALLIGEIDVLVVSDGVLTLPGAMLAHNAEPAVREAWLADNFLPPDAFDWALDPRRREFQLDIGRNRRE